MENKNSYLYRASKNLCKPTIGYTKGRKSIITLKILGKTDEYRDHIVVFDYAMFNTNRALVIDIENRVTKEKMMKDEFNNFIYEVGKEVYLAENRGKNLENLITNNELWNYGIRYVKTKDALGNTSFEDGVHHTYHSNGQVASESFYYNGKMEELYRCWDTEGKLISYWYYEEGWPCHEDFNIGRSASPDLEY